MKSILLDSDVILDFLFKRELFFEDAEEVLVLCENKFIKAYVTPVIISNIYYLLRQQANHDKVINAIVTLLRYLDVLSMDKKVVEEALHSQFRDFEDALQNFSAILSDKVDIIVTRNVKDYKSSTLSIMSPSDFLASF